MHIIYSCLYIYVTTQNYFYLLTYKTIFSTHTHTHTHTHIYIYIYSCTHISFFSWLLSTQHSQYPSFLRDLPSFLRDLPSFLSSFVTFFPSFLYNLPSFLRDLPPWPSFVIFLPSLLPSCVTFFPSFLPPFFLCGRGHYGATGAQTVRKVHILYTIYIYIYIYIYI